MTLITLQTDFGTRDSFVATMKAVILGIAPGATLLDVTHEIPAFDLRTPGLNWLNLAPSCPAGTVHVGVIDPGVGTSRAIVLARWNTQWYLCPDNGLLTPLIAQWGLPEICYRVENRTWMAATEAHPTFHGRDIFAPVAAYLAQGADPAKAGPAVTQLALWEWPRVLTLAGSVVGSVIHTDHFGNAWSNIRLAHLAEANLDRAKISVECAGRPIAKLSRTYAEAPAGTLVALENSHGWIEIALAHGSAAVELDLKVGSPVVCRG